MLTTVLATKLFTPPPRPGIVVRPRLIERMEAGLRSGCKLTLISAPAGFGKSTLVSEWAAGCKRSIAWLSLDEGDNDLTRFLTYLLAALQLVAPNLGEGMSAALQSPKPPSTEAVLTALLNESAAVPEPFTLVLDDYHVVDAKAVDEALGFLVDHLPAQMQLVIATREDPRLPLARLRARGQLTELRAADLRFTPAESAEFLNRIMGLDLAEEEVAALEARTEGWIAGLQLAAISMQGYKDASGFIQSFTGSHHFVLDYLVEEVLGQQPESVQAFLLRTSILDRMCGPLCDAVLGDPSARGQETLETLERANMFIVPLDNERRWYRYHHLFAELLRQRLGQGEQAAQYHIRASQWYEESDMMLEAFRHAAAAHDLERAVRLMESKKMPLEHPGVATTILSWLESLPAEVLNARPALWWKQAALMITASQTVGVEEKLQATEAALSATAAPGAGEDESTRNLIGKIAVARALLAQNEYQIEPSLSQARSALEYLHPDNLAYRSTANQVIGFAHYMQGDWAEAVRAYTESLSLARAAGDTSKVIMAISRLAQIQEFGNQLHEAAGTYRQALQLIGENPYSDGAIVHLGLGRIYYEWNDLEAAGQYGEEGRRQAMQYDQVVDRIIVSELLLAQVKLARGEAAGAASILAQAEQTTRQKNFPLRLPSIAAAQVLVLIRQGNLEAAAQLAQQYDLPLRQARVRIAQNDPAAALRLLESLRANPEEQRWARAMIEVIALQAIAYHMQGDEDKAMEALEEALARAEEGGNIRTFLEMGAPMARLLAEAVSQGIRQGHAGKLLAAFEAERIRSQAEQPPVQPHSELLSERELEVLRLVAQGCSNQEIGRRLFLALDTVKGHNRRIFEKLQVKRRTEAIARARELGLI